MPTSAFWFVEDLWLGGDVDGWWSRSSAGTSLERFVAIPGGSSIQQLLPWRPSSIVAATNRVSDDRSRFSAIRDASGVAALLIASPFTSGRRFGVRCDRSFTSHVAEQLGVDRPTFGSVLFGPARANRKPVVQLHDRRGRPIAWVKVGTTDLTRKLLDQEIRTLTKFVAGNPKIKVPAVLAVGQYGEAQWAALEPMSVAHRVRPTAALVDDVAMSIERTSTRWEGRVDESSLLIRLRSAADGLTSAAGAIERLAVRHGHRPLVLTAAHGDLVPWNMLSGRPKPAVWDWERYDVAAPAGFDRIHNRVQVAVQKQSVPLTHAVAHAETELSLHHDLPVESWPVQIDFYLATLLCRYERDAESHPNPRLLGRIRDLAGVLTERGVIA